MSESILSNVLSGRSFRYAHMTSLPKPRNTPESSAAMYPAPKTIALLGNSVNSKNPFESMAYSPPGMVILLARPPVAIKILGAR